LGSGATGAPDKSLRLEAFELTGPATSAISAWVELANSLEDCVCAIAAGIAVMDIAKTAGTTKYLVCRQIGGIPRKDIGEDLKLRLACLQKSCLASAAELDTNSGERLCGVTGM